MRPLLDELVFVGGCAAGLLITDPGSPAIRATIDVDAITEARTYAGYVALAERLRTLGFHEDASDGAPVCRWISGQLIFDVMPLDESVLGFSNLWYEEAMRTAQAVEVSTDLTIRLISAPAFLATKVEAFRSRGRGGYLGSHDLEDALAVVDGRPELSAEIEAASDEVQNYLANEFAALLRDHRFVDALPGHLPPDAAGQARVGLLLRRLKAIARVG